MSLIGLLFVLALLWGLVGLLYKYVAPGPFHYIATALMAFVSILLIVQFFGVNTAPIPKLKIW